MNRLNQEVIKRFKDLLGEENVLVDEPMNRHTTFRIGGPADLFLMPGTTEEIQKILALCKECEIPFFILGNGSNLLVSDQGYRGAVIQIYKNLNQVFVHGHRIVAQAGALLSTIAAAARNASLTGFEFAGGIPGTLGGAAVMNAGAYGGEMKQVLEEVTAMTPAGEVIHIPARELELEYRSSVIKKNHWIVLEAVIELQPGDEDEIRDTMRDLSQRRIDKQPLEFPSAGSTFKRPVGYFAGKLIMDAGLRGYRVGDAMVSEKHCGFVINVGEATAADVCQLMKDVSERVEAEFGVTLEPEVKFLGEF
ncbi:MAG: UDP-N-acetylmuramate dehydrogenase [Eubacteriales bacterium]|nr:UDP-N-acetylmuramate dehydrogenase [Eubacteriales bacterium]